jgi:NhaP-type Na+/H+ or K+/H+ antiporter
VLFGILPPLIYSAGVAMSWREFRFNLRPIALLAFGYVVFTTCAVAATAHWLLGMPLAVAFVLGAIVAPTDAVAPVSIMRQMGVPRRLVVILEGEGLANDATALILYRFAVATAGTGLFSLGQAAGTFALIVVVEIAFGIGIGLLRLRRWARDPRVEITLSLLTPYAAFLIPAHLGGSGVLATMTAGLFASWNGPLLIPAATRLQGIFFWDLVVYLVEGMVFLVTGLQMRTLLDRTGTVLLYDSIFSRIADCGGGYRSAVYVDLSGGLHTSLAQPIARTAGSASAVAMALLSCVCRGARRCFARGGTSDSTDHRNWYAVSVPRSHPLRHIRCDRRDLGGPGIVAAERCSLAWIDKPCCRRA